MSWVGDDGVGVMGALAALGVGLVLDVFAMLGSLGGVEGCG